VLTEQLQGALNNRIVIEQAMGAIAQAHGLSVDERRSRRCAGTPASATAS
jgi:hypothetical protein